MDVFKFLHLSSTNLRAKMFGAEAKSKDRLWRFKCSKEQERKESGCVWFVVFKEALHNFQDIVINDIHVQKVSRS